MYQSECVQIDWLTNLWLEQMVSTKSLQFPRMDSSVLISCIKGDDADDEVVDEDEEDDEEEEDVNDDEWSSRLSDDVRDALEDEDDEEESLIKNVPSFAPVLCQRMASAVSRLMTP